MKLLFFLFFSGTCFAQSIKSVVLHRDSLAFQTQALPTFTYDTIKVVFTYINTSGVIVSGKGYEVVKESLSTVSIISRLDKNKKLLNPATLASVPIRFNWKK